MSEYKAYVGLDCPSGHHRGGRRLAQTLRPGVVWQPRQRPVGPAKVDSSASPE